jgi:hypothetical protein
MADVFRTTEVLSEANAKKALRSDATPLELPLPDGGMVFATPTEKGYTTIRRNPCNHAHDEPCEVSYVVTIELYDDVDEYLERGQEFMDASTRGHELSQAARFN